MTSNTTLFNFTLQRPQNAYLAVSGYFSAPLTSNSSSSGEPRTQEVIIARTKGIEMFRLVDRTFVSVLYTDVFATIRDMKTFRLPGSEQDLLVVGSDSGKFIVLRYCSSKNIFERVVEETYGKTGIRRIIPGQHLAVDPDGRAVMISALEKMKLVYTLSPGQSLTSDGEDTPPVLVKSPLEAHKAHTVVYSTCGVHVPGFSNPTFACLEASYEENEVVEMEKGRRVLAKSLVFYELDLGVNSVNRIMAQPVDSSATAIFTVPCDPSIGAPGGVLVCAEDAVYLHPYSGPDLADEAEDVILSNIFRAPLPRRYELESSTVLISAVTTCFSRRKRRGSFYFLASTELGDIFRIDITSVIGDNADGLATATATDIVVGYFDSTPPTSAFVSVESCLVRPDRPDDKLVATDYLFAFTEGGAQHIFRINPAPVMTATSSHLRAANVQMDSDENDTGDLDHYHPVAGKNLEEMFSDVSSVNPILGLIPTPENRNLGHYTSELFAISGTGHRSTVRGVRPGLGIEELVRSPLPGNPSALFSIPESFDVGAAHELLILSFPDSTVVLRAGESMEEVEDSGVIPTVESLLVARILEGMAVGDVTAGESSGAMVQVHSSGVRLIRQTSQRVITADWRAPGTIVAASHNDRQVTVALVSGEIFLLEPEGGQLRDICRAQLQDVSCLALAPIPKGLRRAPFLVVGDFKNNIRLLKIKTTSDASGSSTSFVPFVHKTLPAPASSLVLVAHSSGMSASLGKSIKLTLYVGMNNGMLERLAVDNFSGHLTDPHDRLLGSLPVRLQAVVLGNHPAVIGMSSRTWAFYEHAGSLLETPLAYEPIAAAVPFSSSLDPFGVMAVSANLLRLLSVPKLGETFNYRTSAPLHYTPRRMEWYIPSSACSKSLVDAARTLAQKSASEMNQTHLAPASVSISPAKALVVIEADDAALPVADRMKILTEIRTGLLGDDEDEGKNVDPEQEASDNATQDYFCGVPGTESGNWASCIRLVDPVTLGTLVCVELEENMAATSVCVFDSHADPSEAFLAVGVVKGLKQLPRRSFESSEIRLYKITQKPVIAPADEDDEMNDEDEQPGQNKPMKFISQVDVTFIHQTPVPEIVSSLAVLKGSPSDVPMILAGCGSVLKMYQLGLRKWLLKLENRNFTSTITHIRVSPCSTRAYVADAMDGVFFLGVNSTENQRRLDIIAVSPTARYVSAMTPVDFDTVAVADRFGNISIQRFTSENAVVAEDNLTSNIANKASGGFQERPKKPPVHLTEIAATYVGDMITSIVQTSLLIGGPSVLIYTTISGAMCALVPLVSFADAEYFTHLEMFLRREVGSLVGRDHLSYRSTFHPTSSIIDGDLLSIFPAAHAGVASRELSKEQLENIAESVASTPKEVVKKIVQVKQRVM